MSKKIFDITRTIFPDLAIWPGDSPFAAEVIASMGRDDPVNLTTITLSSHTGTHVDAPYHYTKQGATIEQIPLDAYIGPATVVTVQRREGALTPEDFSNLDWSRLQRLLIHSAASDYPTTQFPTDIVYPSPELADVMGQHGVVLFGSDAPSMDDIESKLLPGHNALYHNGIAILEGLLLTDVPDGEYELIALPLKIGGSDGSPVRAVLRA